jgi:molecular chaperone HscB
VNVSEALQNKNFFELFSLPESFNIDSRLLKQNYRLLQGQYHPDKLAAESESKKLLAVQMSSLLNDAFEILSSPVKRANYLLQLSGINLQEDRQIDPSILHEQIDFREQLEALKVLDKEEREDALSDFQKTIQVLFKKACMDFSESQEKNDASFEALNKMKQNLSRMLFLDKLQAEIELALEEFD